MWKYNPINNYPTISYDSEWALNVLKDQRIVKSFHKNLRYYDEPLLYQFSVNTQDAYALDAIVPGVEAGGASFDVSVALCKSAGEAAERFCLASIPPNAMTRGTFATMTDSPAPHEFQFFAPSQLSSKLFESFNWNEHTSFHWSEGFDVTRNRSTQLPSQLVYLPYQYYDENYIMPPSTSGGACGRTIEQCTLSGMFELLERDAFMIHYLSKTEGIRIDLSGNSLFTEIEEYLARFNLKLRTYLLQTDFPVCPVLAMIVDEALSEVPAPWISTGLKCSFDPTRAVLGAIEEACQTRPWIRMLLQEIDQGIGPSKKERASDIIIDRALYWSAREKIRDVSFLIDSKRSIRFEDVSTGGVEGSSGDLESLLAFCRAQGHPVYRVDISTPEVQEHGLVVCKVIMPTLQQFYLNEPSLPLGSTRWRDVPFKLGLREDNQQPHNPVPHFFL
jgi:ribosomal protein S12 methylthiotransferase accessory factor